jgi:hypothetical protein
MSMKNSNDTVGNRARDLPVCNALPQPTAPPRDPQKERLKKKCGNSFCTINNRGTETEGDLEKDGIRTEFLPHAV